MVSLSQRLKYVLKNAKSKVIMPLFNTNKAGIKLAVKININIYIYIFFSFCPFTGKLSFVELYKQRVGWY